MKHTFLPTSSLFYISLIASSYPSLSFRFEILENLKLTKEGISKARARAAPGLPAKGTQYLGCFASTPAKNLPSSSNGSQFFPEEAKQPSSVSGQTCFSDVLALPCVWSCSWDKQGLQEHHWSFLLSPRPPLLLARLSGWERHRELPSPSFPFPEPVAAMTTPWYRRSRLFGHLFVQVMDISCAAPSCCP